MAFSFWITATLVLAWLVYRFLRIRVENSVERNRQRVLDEIQYTPPEHATDNAPTFLGFFHPYW